MSLGNSRVVGTLALGSLLGALVAAAGVGPAQGEPRVETCRGEPATLVGEPGEPDLIGGDGRDIVVTNGVGSIATNGGDDVICVTGRGVASIDPGDGDDVIDATAFEGSWVGARLATPASGDDVYLGGPARDSVNLRGWLTEDGDHKMIDTGAGNDGVEVDRYSGTAEIRLGSGADEYLDYGPQRGVEVDAGPGRDRYTSACTGCADLLVDLRAGRISVDGADTTLAGTEDVVVETIGSGRERVRLIGTGGPNSLRADGCRVTLDGRGGADRLTASRRPSCRQPLATINAGAGADVARSLAMPAAILGGGGRDTLIGSPRADRLIGGPGRDVANGRGGADVCSAEVTRSC